MADRKQNAEAIAALNERLKRARATGGTPSEDEASDRPPPTSMGPALGLAFRVTSDLVVGVAVGALVGYGLDRWLGTTPWLMILMFFLGTGAGGMNAYRTIIGASPSPVIKRPKPEPKPSDRDGPEQTK